MPSGRDWTNSKAGVFHAFLMQISRILGECQLGYSSWAMVNQHARLCADDYLTKPFGLDELMARMRVVLRHALPGEKEPVFESAGLRVDLGRCLVTVGGQEVCLTLTEYDLLRVLVQNAGKVLTHRNLLALVWGAGYSRDAQLLRATVSNLRGKIEEDSSRPVHLMTEPGVDYRLE